MEKVHQRSSSPKSDDLNISSVVNNIPYDISLVEGQSPHSFFLETGDSTRSLLTPLYAADYESFRGARPNFSNNQSEMKEAKENNSKSSSADKPRVTKTKSHSSKHTTSNSCQSLRSKSSVSLSSSSKTSSSKSNTSLSSSDTSSSSESSSSNPFQNTYHCAHNSNTNDRHQKTWNDWVIEKMLKRIEGMKLEKEQKIKERKEKIAVENEKLKNIEYAKENRKEWLRKKSFEIKKVQQEKSAQLEFDKLKKSQEDELLKMRAKDKFEDWCALKDEKEKLMVRTKHTDKKKNELSFSEKKKASNDAYTKWKKKKKCENQISRNSYGYSDGNLFCYYDMTSHHEPSFSNPVPWVDTIATVQIKNEALFSSPPLLWEDVRKREELKKGKKCKINQQKVVLKHSCVGMT